MRLTPEYKDHIYDLIQLFNDAVLICFDCREFELTSSQGYDDALAYLKDNPGEPFDYIFFDLADEAHVNVVDEALRRIEFDPYEPDIVTRPKKKHRQHRH